MMMEPTFQHILRVLNTNIDGRERVYIALTAIKGVGRRYADMVCKKAEVDRTKRAGELSPEEIEKVIAVIQNPTTFKIPTWFLNRQKDYKTGKNTHVSSNTLDTVLRDDLERLKKIRCALVAAAAAGRRSTGRAAPEPEPKPAPHPPPLPPSSNRGLRHHWGIKVRGQHTKTSGRRGRTLGVTK